MVRAAREEVKRSPLLGSDFASGGFLVPTTKDSEESWLARRCRCQKAGLAAAKSKATAKLFAAAGPLQPHGHLRKEHSPHVLHPRGRPQAAQAPEEESRPHGRPRM